MSKPEDEMVEEMAEKFYVIYDGWALEHHLMDVRDLAPAMIAVNDLLSNANKALNGDKADLNLKVNASFKAKRRIVGLISLTSPGTLPICTGVDRLALIIRAGIR